MNTSVKFLAILTLISGFCCQACVTDGEPSSGVDLKVGDALPSFSVTFDNGERVTTASLEGKKSVIVFFNTSCPDCREELPVVQLLWENYGEQPDIMIFAIARQQDAESIGRYWEENDLTIPWSAQSDRKIYELFASSGIPRIFISNPEGIITASFNDSPLPSYEMLEASLLN